MSIFSLGMFGRGRAPKAPTPSPHEKAEAARAQRQQDEQRARERQHQAAVEARREQERREAEAWRERRLRASEDLAARVKAVGLYWPGDVISGTAERNRWGELRPSRLRSVLGFIDDIANLFGGGGRG